MTEERRIYVACLASYNNGRLHGAWIDAEQDADSIREEIAAMLAASPEPGAEEWAIHDSEGFEGIDISESDSIDTVAALARALADHGEPFAAFYNNDPWVWSWDIDGCMETFEERYQGTHNSEQEFAKSLKNLRPYFDYEAWTRDLFMGDYWSARASDGGVHVFTNR